jgi:hypothetical protein
MKFGFKDPEVYPLDASKSGTNAHHINGCRVVGQSQPYAACLNRIAEYEAGGAIESMGECRRAIGGPACEAWKMREEENKAGKALFYVNRAKLQEYVGLIASDRPQQRSSDDKPARASTPPQPDATSGSGSYADAINATIQTLSSPSTSGQTEHLEPTNQQEQE